MKPVDQISITKVGRNPFQERRREELRAFWDSGVQFAELETQGTISMSRERALYARARTMERIPYDEIKFHQRGKKLYAERRKDRNNDT